MVHLKLLNIKYQICQLFSSNNLLQLIIMLNIHLKCINTFIRKLVKLINLSTTNNKTFKFLTVEAVQIVKA